MGIGYEEELLDDGCTKMTFFYGQDEKTVIVSSNTNAISVYTISEWSYHMGAREGRSIAILDMTKEGLTVCPKCGVHYNTVNGTCWNCHYDKEEEDE